MEDVRTTKIFEEIKLLGCVVDRDLLGRIDAICAEAVSDPDGDKSSFVQYSLSKGRDTHEFSSFDKLIAELEGSPQSIRSVSLKRTFKRKSGIDIAFGGQGVKISGFSNNPEMNIFKGLLMH